MKRFVYLLSLCFLLFSACSNDPNQANNAQEPAEPTEPVYSMVEEMPRFPGCEEKEGTDRQACANKKLLEYVRSSLKYPETAKANKKEGQAVVSFHVEKDGSITNVEIVRDLEWGMGKEAKRIVESFPKFIPGKQNGEAVIVRYNLPIKFNLN
ncbi:MAG: energy transducer TonB [Bacteroidota bacterium]